MQRAVDKPFFTNRKDFPQLKTGARPYINLVRTERERVGKSPPPISGGIGAEGPTDLRTKEGRQETKRRALSIVGTILSRIGGRREA